MADRLELIERALSQDGLAPETLSVLDLMLEELRYLRGQADRTVSILHLILEELRYLRGLTDRNNADVTKSNSHSAASS